MSGSSSGSFTVGDSSGKGKNAKTGLDKSGVKVCVGGAHTDAGAHPCARPPGLCASAPAAEIAGPAPSAHGSPPTRCAPPLGSPQHLRAPPPLAPPHSRTGRRPPPAAGRRSASSESSRMSPTPPQKCHHNTFNTLVKMIL